MLSSNETLGDSDDQILGEFQRSGLVPAGGSYSMTEIIPLDRGLSGRFQVFIQTDVADDVFELPVNTIYELDFSQYGSGTYNIELRSFTGIIRKTISIK